VKLVLAVPDRSPSVHVISTGTLPLDVLRPTCHFQVTAPAESAVLGPNPFAVEGPESYWTTMPQSAFLLVLIVTEAVVPGAALDVCLVTLTGRSAAFGSVLGRGVSITASVASGSGVSSADGASRPTLLSMEHPDSRRAKTSNAFMGADYRATRAVTWPRYPRGMARRADPARIFQAWRIAIRNNLTRSGMSLETAERSCDAWELEAAGRGLPRAPIGKPASNGSQPNGRRAGRDGK
jgi:hypothetical protein